MYGKKPAMTGKPAAMPAQANKGGAVRGQARATAVKPTSMPAQASKGMAKRPTGRGM
jgi:hypothetical protein